MKLLKSSFAKKLIIILVILMLFNAIVPQEVKAWDLGGILIKPFTSIALGFLINVDVTIGVLFNGLSIAVDTVGAIVEQISNIKDVSDAYTTGADGKITFTDTAKVLSKLFVGPDAIFSGKVEMFDANIFVAESITDLTKVKTGNLTSKDDILKNIEAGIDITSSAVSPGHNMIMTIKESIASVYVVLRDVCGFIMLAGLIFTGIRILVSSNNPQKGAQWRQMMFDWFVGMCLLIFSHVIMVGIFRISDLIVTALSNKFFGFGGLNFNLAVQCLTSFDSAEQIICLIMLAYMIYLTVIFAISYFKRLLWICVLIIIAPVVSIMYAFGPQTKQIYSKWLREYIMTVFVQPFHVVVYYALTAVPLNMVNSTGGISLTGNSILEIIYALAAMSFIRPAESYIRNLFGFNQGLAEKASFDSGKKTATNAAKVITVAAGTAATAGLGTAVAGAIKSGAAIKKVADVGRNIAGNFFGDSKVGSKVGKLAKGAITGSENVLTTIGEKTGLIDANSARPKNNSKTVDNPPPVDNPPKDENDKKKPEVTKKSNPENDLDKQIADVDAQIKAKENERRGALNRMNETKDDDSMASEYAIARADSTRLAGEIGDLNKLKQELEEQKGVKTVDTDVEEEEKEEEKPEEKEGEKTEEKEGEKTQSTNNDGKVKIENQGKDEQNKIDQSLNKLATFMGVATGNKGISEALEGINPDSKLGQIAGAFTGSEVGKAFKKFEDLGGVEQTHAALNELRAGFYATPPPDDWKATNENMANRTKERVDQIKMDVQNNEEYKNFLMNDPNGPKLLEKYKHQYPDKSDEYVRDKAEKASEEKLKSLSETYVPLGVTDARVMYQCAQDCKNYGIQPQEAVKNFEGYQKFNIDANNVTKINGIYSTNGKSVSEVFGKNPDNSKQDLAKVYYDNGYRDVDRMSLVHQLSTTLNVSTKYAMQLDQALSKKGGKISYDKSALTDAQNTRLTKILDSYKSITQTDNKNKA